MRFFIKIFLISLVLVPASFGMSLHEQLMKAVESDNRCRVEELIVQGVDVNAEDGSCQASGWTALHGAANKSSSAIVKMLIAAGANVNACDEEGAAPLHIAAMQDRADIVEILMNAGADVNLNEQDAPLHFAAERNSVTTARLLLDRGADVDTQDCEEMTPLHRAAARRGSSTMIQMLIEAGADINARDQEGKTPLYHAMFEDRPDTVQFLLSLGADVNVRDSDGDTLLHYAVSSSPDTIKMLVKAGIASNVRNQEGQTALHHAIFNGRLDIVQILMSVGVDVHTRDSSGNTLLHYIVKQWNAWNNKKYIAIAKVLINAGIDVNVRNSLGRTPLFMAVVESIPNASSVLQQTNNKLGTINVFAVSNAKVCDMTDLIKFLIESGADVNRFDNQMVSPLQIAFMFRNVPIIDILAKNRVTSTVLLEAGLKLYSSDLVRLALMRGAIPEPKHLQWLKTWSNNNSIAEAKNAYALLGRILNAYFKILGDASLKHGGVSKQGLGDTLPNEIKVKIAQYVAQNVK